MAQRPLPIICTPEKGELLGSWLARLAAIYRISVNDLLKHAGVDNLRPKNFGWVTLRTLTAGALEKLAVALRREKNVLQSMNAPPISIADNGQLPFCPQCFASDISAKRPIFWRRIWGTPFASWCVQHQGPYIAIDGSTLRFTANWQTARLLLEMYMANLPSSPPWFPANAQKAGLLDSALSQDEHLITWRRKLYSLAGAHQLQLVVTDLLDALVQNEKHLALDSALAKLAALIEINLSPKLLTTIRSGHFYRNYLMLKSFDARVFALSTVHDLLTQSALRDRCTSLSTSSPATLRSLWLSK